MTTNIGIIQITLQQPCLKRFNWLPRRRIHTFKFEWMADLGVLIGQIRVTISDQQSDPTENEMVPLKLIFSTYCKVFLK